MTKRVYPSGLEYHHCIHCNKGIYFLHVDYQEEPVEMSLDMIQEMRKKRVDLDDIKSRMNDSLSRIESLKKIGGK